MLRRWSGLTATPWSKHGPEKCSGHGRWLLWLAERGAVTGRKVPIERKCALAKDFEWHSDRCQLVPLGHTIECDVHN